jgi:pilus assembly protein CpaB
MNRNRLLLIGLVALALGGLVSYGLYQNLKSKTLAANLPGVDAVVAADDISVGDKIGMDDVKVVRFPEGTVPPNAFVHPANVIGRGVILPISKGEFILTNKLADAKAGSGLPSLIPNGMRAVSVRVNEVVSVAGFVTPGTRVDILLTGNPNNGEEQQTSTVLENVEVLATGQHMDRSSGGEPQQTPVITLLVSPDDAQKLTLASTQGKIQLSLRNPLDTKQQELAAVNTGTIYKHMSAPVAAAPHVVVRHTAAPAAPPPPQKYSVEVIRGDKKSVWTDQQGESK